MYHMRPGTKVPFGKPGYKNKPLVEPPGLLRLASALCILSIVGVAVYSVFLTLGSIGLGDIDSELALYVAILHFLLPFGIAYTVTTNNRLSRVLIAVYALSLYSATLFGKGFLGSLEVPSIARTVAASSVVALIGIWLFASPKMRYYYAALSNQTMPEDLEARSAELTGSNWINPRLRAGVDWIADHIETLVLLGFAAVAVYSCATTS